MQTVQAVASIQTKQGDKEAEGAKPVAQSKRPTVDELLALSAELDRQKPKGKEFLKSKFVSLGIFLARGQQAQELYNQKKQEERQRPLQDFAEKHCLDVATARKVLDLSLLDLRGLRPDDPKRAAIVKQYNDFVQGATKRIAKLKECPKVRSAAHDALIRYKQDLSTITKTAEKGELIVDDLAVFDLDQNRQALIDFELALRKLENEAQVIALQVNQGQTLSLTKFTLLVSELTSLTDAERKLANDTFQSDLEKLLALVAAAKESLVTGNLLEISKKVAAADAQYALLQNQVKGLEGLKEKNK